MYVWYMYVYVLAAKEEASYPLSLSIDHWHRSEVDSMYKKGWETSYGDSI
jgi:hypothetical protein